MVMMMMTTPTMMMVMMTQTHNTAERLRKFSLTNFSEDPFGSTYN